MVTKSFISQRVLYTINKPYGYHGYLTKSVHITDVIHVIHTRYHYISKTNNHRKKKRRKKKDNICENILVVDIIATNFHLSTSHNVCEYHGNVILAVTERVNSDTHIVVYNIIL